MAHSIGLRTFGYVYTFDSFKIKQFLCCTAIQLGCSADCTVSYTCTIWVFRCIPKSLNGIPRPPCFFFWYFKRLDVLSFPQNYSMPTPSLQTYNNNRAVLMSVSEESIMVLRKCLRDNFVLFPDSVTRRCRSYLMLA